MAEYRDGPIAYTISHFIITVRYIEAEGHIHPPSHYNSNCECMESPTQPKNSTRIELLNLHTQTLESTILFLKTNPLLICGLNRVQNFYNDSKLKSWENLKTEYNLLANTQNTCLCILHLMSKHPLPNLQIPLNAW